MESLCSNIGYPEAPFLLRCAENGIMGDTIETYGGRIVDGGFIYLIGKPDIEAFAARVNEYRSRMMICMNDEWRAALLERFPELVSTMRFQMTAPQRYVFGSVPELPADFVLRMFGTAEFELHPFGHGRRYSDYTDFMWNGSGAVIYHDGEIVASCSSFITFGRELELDVFVKKEYRRMGLAANCAAAMLRDCTFRGFSVHWDAQNDASRRLAESFGYTVGCTYEALSFCAPEM